MNMSPDSGSLTTRISTSSICGWAEGGSPRSTDEVVIPVTRDVDRVWRAMKSVEGW